MKNILSDKFFSPPVAAVLRREWLQFFSTPIGPIYLGAFILILMYFTFAPGHGAFFLRAQADLRPMFQYLPWPLCFFVSAISMRAWAEERRSGTIELLLTLPMSSWQATWGKYLAGHFFICLTLLLTFPMVITVFYLGGPDIKAIFLNYLGAIFLSGQMYAVALFFSSFSKNQVASFIMSALGLFILFFIDSPPMMDIWDDFFSSFFLSLISHLGYMGHYENWSRGILRWSDFLFFLVQITFWVYATSKVVDMQRES